MREHCIDAHARASCLTEKHGQCPPIACWTSGDRSGMMAAIALVSLGLAVLNVFSTLSVVRSPLSSTGQKVAQIFLVWLLPLLGALLVLIIRTRENLVGRASIPKRHTR